MLLMIYLIKIGVMHMSSVVSVVDVKKHPSLQDSIKESLDLLNYKLPQKIKRVLIKPNLCYYWESSTGYTTDPELVSAVIQYLRQELDNPEVMIAEADASAMRVNLAYKILGYEKLSSKYSIKLINLSEEPSTEIKQTINNQNIIFQLPTILNEVDLLINMPKLKIMRHTKISCAMKNLFGAISNRKKIAYHKKLTETIVTVNKIVKPHLTIVDGIISLGKYPRRLDMIMSGTNTYSVDWIASQIAGYDPNTVKFLNLYLKENDLTNINVKTIGEKIDRYKKIFPRESKIPTDTLWKAELALLNLYTKIVGDNLPPILMEM